MDKSSTELGHNLAFIGENSFKRIESESSTEFQLEQTYVGITQAISMYSRQV